jgi:nucleoside-diphosphate-sugar epimerase
MTRSESKRGLLAKLGAVAVVADAVDADQVAEAVGRANPDVIVHQLTALAGVERYTERYAAPTNRLRTEGTDHLLSAGQAVGVRRFVAQGVAGFGAYARSGGSVKSEEDPLDPAPVREMRETLAAIRHLEAAVLGAESTEGIVLRYGAFYGPGTSLAPGEEHRRERRGTSSARSATRPIASCVSRSADVDVDDLDGVVSVSEPVPGRDLRLGVAGCVRRSGAEGVACNFAAAQVPGGGQSRRRSPPPESSRRCPRI